MYLGFIKSDLVVAIEQMFDYNLSYTDVLIVIN